MSLPRISIWQRTLARTLLLLILLPTVVCSDSLYSPMESNFARVSNLDINLQNLDTQLPYIVVEGPEDLGRLAALRFIEWVDDNPSGVVSLPVGKSAEYFIRYLLYYKKSWSTPEVKAEVVSLGIKLKEFPSMEQLKLVQTHEIFPIPITHRRSIRNFILNYYVEPLGIKLENTLLMPVVDRGILKKKGIDVVFRNLGNIDWDLTNKNPKNSIERWQKQALLEANGFCKEFEETLKSWGGVDLYIGSMGYQGELALNDVNTSYDSKTRLVHLGSITSAQIAREFGGIEFAKKSMGVSVGLATLSFNENATAIILVNGGVNSKIIRDFLNKSENSNIPAVVFNATENTKVYLSVKANNKLHDESGDVSVDKSPERFVRTIDKLIIDVALQKGATILELDEEDIKNNIHHGENFLKKINLPFNRLKQSVHNRVVNKIQAGMSEIKAKKILHMGVYHDDIVVGYYPIMRQLLRHNQNSFVYLTSGVNSVSDIHIISALSRVDHRWLNKSKHVIFNKRYYEIVDDFARSYWAGDHENLALNETVITLKQLCKIYDIKSLAILKETIRWLKDEYFPKKQPGDVDSPAIVNLKRLMRESEADKLWAINNIWSGQIHHMNLPFYSYENVFHTMPSKDVDVDPLIKILNRKKPDIITIPDIPERFGSDAPYKSKIILSNALRFSDVNPNTKILTYRNFGYKYHLASVDKIMLIKEKDISMLVSVFDKCFSSQRESSFPSPLYTESPTATVANAQREQYQEIKSLIGAEVLEDLGVGDAKAAVTVRFQSIPEFSRYIKKIEDLSNLKSI